MPCNMRQMGGGDIAGRGVVLKAWGSFWVVCLRVRNAQSLPLSSYRLVMWPSTARPRRIDPSMQRIHLY